MNNRSRETLRRVTLNDPSLTGLGLPDNNDDYVDDDGDFFSENSNDYSTLGTAIANNTHLENLVVALSDDLPLTVTDRGFYDGLRRNSSIYKLYMYCNTNPPFIIARGVGQEILKAYQENNSHLTYLRITNANLQNGGDRVVADTLRCCRNLQSVTLINCNTTCDQLLPMIDAIRGHSMLEELNLGDNNIGNTGCDALATLLIEDPNSNMHTIDLEHNAINNEGATTIANSLTNNNKLQHLHLYGNPIDRSVQDVFSNMLCNTSNINSTYSSNHTLLELTLPRVGQELSSLLDMNTHTNKSHVAIKKIIKFHPNIDMEPLFQWDAEGEQTLKALSHVMNWFEKAKVAVADEVEDVEHECDRIEDRMLSAIFQFAKAMPLLLEGVVNVIVDADKKRKRLDGR